MIEALCHDRLRKCSRETWIGPENGKGWGELQHPKEEEEQKREGLCDGRFDWARIILIILLLPICFIRNTV